MCASGTVDDWGGTQSHMTRVFTFSFSLRRCIVRRQPQSLCAHTYKPAEGGVTQKTTPLSVVGVARGRPRGTGSLDNSPEDAFVGTLTVLVSVGLGSTNSLPGRVLSTSVVSLLLVCPIAHACCHRRTQPPVLLIGVTVRVAACVGSCARPFGVLELRAAERFATSPLVRLAGVPIEACRKRHVGGLPSEMGAPEPVPMAPNISAGGTNFLPHPSLGRPFRIPSDLRPTRGEHRVYPKFAPAHARCCMCGGTRPLNANSLVWRWLVLLYVRASLADDPIASCVPPSVEHARSLDCPRRQRAGHDDIRLGRALQTHRLELALASSAKGRRLGPRGRCATLG